MKRYIDQVFKNRTFPLATVLVLIAFALVYYLFHVRGREAYFTHRYLRLLAFESGQIEERLGALESVFASYQKDRTLNAAKLSIDIPGLTRTSPPAAIADEGVALEERIEGDRFWMDARWKQAQGGTPVAFRFDPFELSQPNLSGSFENLFVARRDGTVLYQRAQNGGRELRIVNVGKLLSADGKELDFAALSSSTAVVDVVFAGASYKLFLRPCCRTLWENARQGPASREWIVGGLVGSSRLSGQAWAISFTVGIAVVALFVLALLSIPFLRVLSMGPEEKLRVADALWTGFTALSGVGLLTLLLLDLHAYSALVNRLDHQLDELAARIAGNMQEEIQTARDELGYLNRRAAARLRHRLTAAGGCSDIVAPGAEREDHVWRPFLGHKYADFERFTWVDLEGRQCFKWSLGTATDPLVSDVRERRYFQEALAGRQSLQPVFSWATGRRVAVLAEQVEIGGAAGKPARKLPFVAVLGIDFGSLTQPVLPPGYGFAVIDDQGEVLFHSEPGRSGYENFFEEADHDRGLRAAVYARRPDEVDAAYMGRGHRLAVRPLKQHPSWTLIVFRDKRDLRTFNVDATTTAMLILILYILIWMTACWLLRGGNRRYRAGWLWPERPGEDRESTHLRLTLFYLLAFAAFFAALHRLAGVDLVWFAFAFPWAVLLVSYRLAAGSLPPRRLFLAGAGLLAVLLLILLAPGSGSLAPPWNLAVPGADPARDRLLLLVGSGAAGLFLWPRLLPSRFPALPPRWTYLTAASLLLALVAALPAAAFFCASHRAHLETRIKRGQVELARSLESRQERLTQTYAAYARRAGGPGRGIGPESRLGRLLASRIDARWDVYHSFFYLTELRSASAAGAGEGPREDHRLCPLPHFIQRVLPLYNEDFIRVRRFSEDGGPDADWSWARPQSGTLELRRAGVPLLASQVPPVSLTGFRLLWPGSLALLAGTLFWVAQFVARRFFLFGMPTPDVLEPTTAASGSSESFILVSARTDQLAQAFAAKGAALIDLQSISSRQDLMDCLARARLAEDQRICIHHFEHYLQDEQHNLLKLELMEELIFGRDRPVVVLSHVPPTWYLLDRTPAPSAPAETEDPETAAKRLEMEGKARHEIQERWRKLLRRFTLWVCSSRGDASRLQCDLAQIGGEPAMAGARKPRLARLLAAAREECQESEPLQGLALDLVRARRGDLSCDLFYDDLRERAEPYYRSLWAMCTEAEKLVLVHLAEGGLVNPKNSRAVKMLLRRGLLKRDPSFRLMNESFRRFVASDICRCEVRALERGAETSAWLRLRAPLTAALSGVAVFFFFTQREIFDMSMAFVTALAAALPAFFKVLGAVPGARAKTEG